MKTIQNRISGVGFFIGGLIIPGYGILLGSLGIALLIGGIFVINGIAMMLYVEKKRP